MKSSLLFGGYTDGQTKEIIDGYMSTGDTGRFDDEGRLHVQGRDDEMIVSGGENVFPSRDRGSALSPSRHRRLRGHRRSR